MRTKDHPDDCPCWACVSTSEEDVNVYLTLLIGFAVVLAVAALVFGVVAGWSR